MVNIYSIIEKQVNKYPNKKAIVSESNFVTYKFLNDLVTVVSSYYQKLGLFKGEVVCFLCNNSIGYLVCYLAACRNELCFIPIDWRLTEGEIFKITNIIKPSMVICEVKFKKLGCDILNNSGQNEITIQTFNVLNQYFAVMACIKKPLKTTGLVEDDFTVLFSSGTTGGAKGVIFSQNVIVNQISIYAKYFEMRPEDKVLCPVTLVHSYGIFDHALSALMIGATLFLPNINTMNPRLILDIVHREGITFFGTLPYMYDLIASIKTKKEYDFASVRYMICGGAPLTEETIAKFKHKFDRKINQVYGLTEVGYISFNKNCNDTKSIGKPFDELKLKIVDYEGNECKRGESGELIIKIDYMVARGYLQNSSEQETMYKEGWFYTKDIVELTSDNELYYLGRMSEFLNIGGNKVDSSDIEHVISATQGVKESVVIGVENELGHQEIYAVVVTVNGIDREVVKLEINKNCINKLTAFKRPKKIVFMDSLPKTALGKIRKGKVRSLLVNASIS